MEQFARECNPESFKVPLFLVGLNIFISSIRYNTMMNFPAMCVLLVAIWLLLNPQQQIQRQQQQIQRQRQQQQRLLRLQQHQERASVLVGTTIPSHPDHFENRIGVFKLLSAMILLWIVYAQIHKLPLDNEHVTTTHLNYEEKEEQGEEEKDGVVTKMNGKYSKFMDTISFAIGIILALGSLSLWTWLHAFICRILPQNYRARWLDFTFRLGIQPDPLPRGSVPTAIERIEKIHITTQEEECPICLEILQIGQIARKLPCKHLFHDSCVLPWFQSHNVCPTCRKELDTNDPTYVFHDIQLAHEDNS